MKLARFSLIILLGLETTACWPRKTKATLVLPPPPQPSLAKPAPVIKPPTDVVVPPAEPTPAPAPVVKAPEPPKENPPVTVPAVVTPAPKRKRSSPKPPIVTEIPKAAEQESPLAGGAQQPPAPQPQLREVLTPERRRQYETEFSGSVERAKAAVGRVAGRTNLTNEQREMVNRIRTFLDQAEEAKKDDLGTAWQLARRADLVGQDLIESLR